MGPKNKKWIVSQHKRALQLGTTIAEVTGPYGGTICKLGAFVLFDGDLVDTNLSHGRTQESCLVWERTMLTLSVLNYV